MRDNAFTNARQGGQVLIFGLFALIAVFAVIVLLYNTGQATTEKTRLVNAADASAYSGAVWVARNLNFIAYTNRAMIANHVAMGHFISYVSWVRYVENSSDRLAAVTAFIPYVNVATRVVAQWGDYVRMGTERFAEIFVPAVGVLNETLHAAQTMAKTSMLGLIGAGALTPLHGLMEETARRHHGQMRVNHPDDLATLAGAVSGVGIANEMMRIFDFTERYQPGRDGGRIERLVADSLGDSRRWILGNRGWDVCLLITCARLPGNRKVVKSGRTNPVRSGAKIDWYANDRLGIWRTKRKRWFSYRWRGGTVASGRARASEFARSYAGVPGYYALKDRRAQDQRLFLTAYVTLPMTAAKGKPLLGMTADEQRLAAMARAEIYHERPPTFPGASEYSNLFNPFWRARLTGYQSSIGY